MNVLVDTSVWSLALRRREQELNPPERVLVQALADLVTEGRARLIGLIRQELLSGIRTTAQFEKLRNTLSAFRDEPVNTADHETAAKLYNDCRTKGVASSVVDMLICVVAHRWDMAVFTTDPDFVSYARELPLKLHFVRSQGR